MSIPTWAKSDLRDLPTWVQAGVARAADTPTPQDADAWAISRDVRVSYAEQGRFRVRERRVVRILSDQSIVSAGWYFAWGKSAKEGVRSLKGWNLRPDGELTRMSRNDLISVDADQNGEATQAVGRIGWLKGVVRGSLVAYEAESTVSALGCSFPIFLLEEVPTAHLEVTLEAESGGGKPTLNLETRHFEPWFLPPPPGTTHLSLDNLPALNKQERGVPDERTWHPCLWISTMDPDLKGAPRAGSWDALATWMFRQEASRLNTTWPFPAAPTGKRAALSELLAWIQREFRYQQLYLTPDRAWIPQDANTTRRLRFGDCKDLATLFLACASAQGMGGMPALARIGESPLQQDEPASAWAFNHAIAAILLPESLGLPAEVKTPIGRLLLVDPTSKFTPLGYLPSAYRNGHVMVCTDQGAQWVHIPESAIEPSGLDVHVQGTWEGGHSVLHLVFKETGNQQGLRSSSFLRGPQPLRKHLVRLLDLPPTAAFTVDQTGDPLDLDQPFTMTCTLVTDPLPSVGREFQLLNLGFPPIPDPVQPRGQARQLPLFLKGHDVRHLHLDLDLRGRTLVPMTSGGKLETPFRQLTWRAAVQDGHYHLDMDQQSLDASWDMAHREEGVSAQRKDRNALRALLEEAQTLTAAP
nr:hypothetical protein [uncultured Holophaga sp.]